MELEYVDQETGVIVMPRVRPEFEDGQPRVGELILAESPGYEEPTSIRDLGCRKRLGIKPLGIIRTVPIIREVSGRATQGSSLTEEQPIEVCQLSQMAPAVEASRASRRTLLRSLCATEVLQTETAVKLERVDLVLNAIANLATATATPDLTFIDSKESRQGCFAKAGSRAQAAMAAMELEPASALLFAVGGGAVNSKLEVTIWRPTGLEPPANTKVM